ncbi:hypothetical protein PAEPH01_0611 [Pancytospora epiphaga]|nr:hypothetical protein PAEPH01_0611 [Pancytospora epiphaga]
MYSTIKREGEDKNGVRRVNEHFYKLKEVVNLVQFFIDYGGINKKNVDEYNIKEDDKPSFLIRSYIFEFINNLKDAKEFFRIVNDLIIYTNKGKDGNIWKMFFTEKGEEVRKYKPIFEALRKVDLIISSIKFPFSTYNQPPSNVTVKGYDRGMGKETTDLYFSDCCDITIYTLFCCLLYDPSIEGYSLDQMNKNNYNPSLDLKKFFTDRNNLLDSASGTPPNIHQEWTHVVQNLTLREDELMGGVVSGSNTIIYLKKMGEAAVELETDILNVLKVVAKVSGVPSKRMMELGRITAIAQSDKADISVIKTCIKEYAAKVFGEISAMKIEIDIIDIYSVNIGKCKGIYGKLDIKFRNRDSNNRLFELEHVVRFDFTPMHAGAKVISKNNEIKKEDKENLEGLIKECDKMVLELGKKAANKVRAFLNHRNFELILPKLIEEIELAENKINRYIAINNVLNDCRLTTINEKLYFIDLFSPYLDKVTKDGIENNSNTVLDSTSATFQNLKEFPVKKAKMLDPNDPLLQLISNVLGSVPLNDEATQYFFVQILSSCNGKHRSLFPRIQGAVKIVLPFPVAVAALSNTFEKTLFLDLHDYNVPNMLSRLYKKLRVRHGDSFYKVIAERSPLFNISYIPMVKRCVELNNSAGIEAAKKDFKIRKGKIDLNLDEIGRFRWWLEIAIETQYLKGLEEICNTWEYISKKENTKFRLEVYSAITGSYETNWDKLSSELLKKISVNERYTKALLEMCIYGVDNYTEMNRIYKALAPYLSIQSLASFFENINRELREQLEKMVIIRDSKLSYFSLWEVYSTVEFCIEWIVRMEYWVKKTAEYVHTRDDYDPQSGIIKSLMAIDDGITAMITDGHELKVSIAKEIEC